MLCKSLKLITLWCKSLEPSLILLDFLVIFKFDVLSNSSRLFEGFLKFLFGHFTHLQSITVLVPDHFQRSALLLRKWRDGGHKKKRQAWEKEKPTADKHYLKVMTSRSRKQSSKDPTEDPGQASSLQPVHLLFTVRVCVVIQYNDFHHQQNNTNFCL